MSDADTRFIGSALRKFRGEQHISLIRAPAKRRARICSLGRKRDVMARCVREVMDQRARFDKIANIGSMGSFAAMVMAIVNGQIGDAVGFSASQRLCARNQRFPCSMVDSVNYCKIANNAEAPEKSRVNIWPDCKTQENHLCEMSI